ncbi:claudin-4-like [Hemiscyllium ocellatum]|uniref:claudin-4-like n=1 Tax=Hemiscyllium ocellatum TaxID=170820 RepID=UPI0029664B72|nr:claudin-4-like [Hemiscyllium ocellatum]XP_060678588.1 claudin-4-like [Hemiscyllium ocellatum]
MASSGLQALGISLCLLGLVAAVVCCVLPKWNQSSFVGASIVTAQTHQDGIWKNCVTQSTGQQQCKYYDSILSLPSDVQAARALTVIAIVLSGLGLLLALAGANFTTCLQDEGVKGKVAAGAGGLLVLAGLLVLVPVSWSAHLTVSNFYDPQVTDKREIGTSIWVGWVAAGLLALGGALLCCSWPRGGGAGSGYSAKYINNPAGPARTNV